jgi:NAD(P)-dependent dehydrogenase (short-subunit alcohol dehydrogenase family)
MIPMENSMPVENLFVVTGGSRGIGAEVARLASRQHPVVILYRSNGVEADRVVNEIHEAGGRAWAICADVGDEASLLRAFAQIDSIGRIGALVNNAGITGGVSRVEDVGVETLTEVFRVNVIGAFLAAREAVRRMSTLRGGHGGAIVNVSSGASVLGSPNTWIHYASTKGAMDTMTVGLSKEVAGEGIRVNAVRPGVIDTEIQLARPAHLREKMVAAIPMGRMGTPREIAEAVVWLASPAASYVTGCLLDARGGL